MTKKSKLILGSASLMAVIAIVPAAVISCGADTSTTDNKTTVDNNATALTKINATADTNVDKTATEVAKLLPNNSTNLDPLSSYFDTKLIVNAATSNGVSATYSASVATTKTLTTAVLANATSDTSTTLVITVTMTLGSITSTQAVNVTGFPTQDQVANKGTLIILATNLSKLALTATSTEATKTSSEIHAEISKLTNPTLTDLNTYFDTIAMTTAISAASTTADPITATYAINTISPDNTTDGSINITVTLIVGTGSSLVSYTTILTINGFTSANQAAINTYVTAFQANKDIKGVATVLASTISPATGISMTDIAKYVSGIATLPTNVTATFAITNVANSTGSITLSITLTATNAIATTSAITITGFQTSALALDALAKTIATSYVSTNQSTVLPATAYAALKALETSGTLSISNFSTYFDTTSITTALATLAGTTSSIVLSPVSSDNITNGTLQFSLNLSFDSVTQSVAITLTGFKPTTPSQGTAANLAKLVTIQGNIAKLTFATTTQTSKTPTAVQMEIGVNSTLSTLNTYFPTDGITTALTDGATITDITATLPTTVNTAAGTLDFTATLSLGSAASNDLATLPITFTVSGFLTTNQVAVNAYVASIDGLTAGTITGTNTIQTSDLTVENIESYLHGVPTIPTGSGIALSFDLTNPIPTTGSVDITITASIAAPNAASSVANKVTVTGFLTVNQAAVNAYVAKINALTGNSIITAKNVTIPSSSEITNANYLTYLNNVPAPTDGITLSFALTNPVPTTGSVDITITASIAAPNEASSAASKVTVTGFITTNQATVNAYVASINALTGDNMIKAKSGASLPTTITNSDYTTYLDNVPTLISGITLSFVLSNSNATTGSVDIVITASIAAPNAASAATNSITVNGFLTTDQLKTNAFINKIDDLQAGTITGTNTILPSNLTPENIGSYLNNVPDSTGLVLTYTLSSPNNINGTVSITITASITGSAATSTTLKSISVSGFDTSQNVLTKFVSTFTKTYASTNQDSNIPTVAYDALKGKTAPLTIDDFSTYFNTSAITTALATLSGITISSIILIPVGTPNLTAGTLEFTLNLSYAGVTDSVDITLTGFQTTAESTAQTANLAKLNEIKTTLAGLTTINASSAEANKTSQEVYNEILGISDLTIAKLASYFSIDSINTALGSEVTNTITVNNPNTINIKDGAITFTLSLSLGTAGEQANLNNVTFTATGFMGVVSPITGTVATGPYTNYWSSSPVSNTLGNTATEPSLYIPKQDGSGNEFNSSAVIATSGGTTLPSYISGISWPSGTTSSDVLSWTETGDNATGTATYIVILKNNKTTTLTVTGFMSDKSITNLKFMRIETSSDIGTIPTPATGSAISQNVTAPGITGMYWGPNGGAVNMTLFGGGVSTYSIANSDPTTGSITVLVNFKNGVILSLPVTGYLTITEQESELTTIAQSISTNIVVNTPLTEFSNSSTPITFKLSDIPTWINKSDVLKAIPSWVSTSKATVTIALPTYNASNPSGPTADYSSTTSSKITVSINGINSTPATTTNFESATSYFQTSGIISAKIANSSSYKNIDDFWAAIYATIKTNNALTAEGETINPNGSTTNSNGVAAPNEQSIFDITFNSTNIFNWTVSKDMTYITCAKQTNGDVILRIFLSGNVWYDVTFTPSDFPTTKDTTSTTTPKTIDTTEDKTTTSSSTSSSTTSKDVTPETKTK